MSRSNGWGYTQHVLVIEAVNVGRLPATVNNWSIRFGNGVIYNNPRDPHNTPLPHRLEPQTSAVWTAPVQDFVDFRENFEDESDEAATVRSEIDLQSRRTVVSRERILITSEGTQRVTRWRVSALWKPPVRRLRRLKIDWLCSAARPSGSREGGVGMAVSISSPFCLKPPCCTVGRWAHGATEKEQERWCRAESAEHAAKIGRLAGFSVRRIELAPREQRLQIARASAGP